MDQWIDDAGNELPPDWPRQRFINAFLGPQLISVITTTFLFALALSQSWTYFAQASSTDPRRLKLAIVASLLFVVAGLVLEIRSIYDRAITHAGEINLLYYYDNWQYVSTPILSTLVQLIAQVFFLLRFIALVRHGAAKRWRYLRFLMLAVVGVLIAYNNTVGLIISGVALKTDRAVEWDWYKPWTPYNVSRFVAIAFVDLILAVALCCQLLWFGERLSRGSPLVSILMQLTIATGLTTATCAIIDAAVFYTTVDTSNVFLIFESALPALYLNSMLLTLNSRRPLLASLNERRVLAPFDSHATISHRIEAPRLTTTSDDRSLPMPITLLRPLLLRLTSSFRSDKSDKGVPEGGIEVRREVRYQSFRLSIEDAERHKEGDV